MLLADGINLPIVAVLGIATFTPLTLLVTAVEACVFRYVLKVDFRRAFVPIFIANILSTLAGGVLLFSQEFIVQASGIRDSIPAFVSGYRWLAPCLILGYFLKSILVEGVYLNRPRPRARLEWPNKGVWRTVLLGNLASYLIVGPLFYCTTRPGFAGLETTFDASWAAKPGEIVYFIDREDHHVKRKCIGKPDVQMLIPDSVWAFLVSEDESTFAYVGTNGKLYAYRASAQAPILVQEADYDCFLWAVSLSPDNRRIAYVDPPTGRSFGGEKNINYILKVMDLETREVADVGDLPAADWHTTVGWSAQGDVIYSLRVKRSYDVGSGRKNTEERTVYAFDANPPYGLRDTTNSLPPASDLVVNYGRLRGYPASVSYHGAYIQPPRHFHADDYEVEVWPYMGSGMRIKGDNADLFLQNEYGLLNLSWPALQNAFYLPDTGEFLLEWWGQTYLLDLKNRRLGLAADGDGVVLPSREFRLSFEASSE